jgi:hypothetical protein
MMAALRAWLFRKHCIQHADPLFDRDASGRAVFRCPECLHTWPILPNYEPRPLRQPDVMVAQERRAERLERRPRPKPAARQAAAPSPPRYIGPLPVM